MNRPIDWLRVVRLSLAAFLIGAATTGLGLSNLAFLWVAYTHGGL